MTEQEIEFIELYRSLDDAGKRRIQEFVEFMNQRRREARESEEA